jgi:hypothetical protein
VIDIPAGWAALLVALVAALATLAGAAIAQRASRVARLERENRQLWFGLRLLVDTLYRNGITPHPMVLELLGLDDEMNTMSKKGKT